MYHRKRIDISILLGKTIINIQGGIYEDYLIFETSDREKYQMHHVQSCCESVVLEDICGELEWLLNSPILKAEERTNEEENTHGHNTWTFYELATIKGSITLKWFGSSDGNYSERVEFEKIK